MSDAVLVAVDGGNSKTDLVLLRDDGSVAAAVRGRGSNPHSLTTAGALDVIEDLIDAAWREGLGGASSRRPVMRAGAFFLAGGDQADEVRELHDAITERGWVEEVLVGNDTLALLWAGSASGFGVAVVVGAGVNGVGRAESGLEAHFGALGEITGDWGGGAGIGMAALGSAVRAEEGRGPATTLGVRIGAHFALRTALDVALAIHRGAIATHRLTELPPLVFEAAERGDAEALAIVDHQADEVVGFAVAALRRTRQTADSSTVVVGGSVMVKGPPRLLDRVRAGVAAAAPRASVTCWAGSPVTGAAVAALHLIGAEDAAHRRLRTQLTDERITRLAAVDRGAAR